MYLPYNHRWLLLPPTFLLRLTEVCENATLVVLGSEYHLTSEAVELIPLVSKSRLAFHNRHLRIQALRMHILSSENLNYTT